MKDYALVGLTVLGLLQVATLAYTASIDNRLGRVETVLMGAHVR